MSPVPIVGSAGGEQEIVIRPTSEALRFDLGEHLRYRHLFWALVRRNVQTQFADLRLGFLWVFMRPLLYVTVFVLFRRLSNANVQVSIPYPLYVYSGLILWYYLVESIMQTVASVRGDASIMTKVYYPRLITPMVPSVANLATLGCSMVPLVAMMIYYGVGPEWRLLLLPAVLLQCILLAVGIGAFFASITLTSRDWERALSSTLYVGLFVSPVIYAPEMIPSAGRWAYFLNPMVGSLLAFRSAIFAPSAFPGWQFLYSVAFSLLVLFIGVRTFRAAERHFADRI